MKNEKIIKKYRRTSLSNPTLKTSLKLSKDIENNSNIGNSIVDDENQQNKRKKVKFLTNELNSKTYLSPPKTIIKNQILKKSTKNFSIDKFFNRLTQKHLFTKSDKNIKTENYSLVNKRKSKKNKTLKIPSINPNKINLIRNKIDSDRHLEEIRKNDKYYKFYPILNFKKLKEKQLSLEKNVNNNLKLQTMNNKVQKNIESNRFKKNNILLNNLFPTSINEISEINKSKKTNKTINSIRINENKNYNKTENNYYSNKKKFEIIPKIKLTKKINKNPHKEILDNNSYYNTLISNFKEYQKQIGSSFSLIKTTGRSISQEINNNPFMRKIENLRNINYFEILFKNTIMKNVKTIQEKSKTGFFLGECAGVNSNKNKLSGNYICENRANIFNVSEMVDKMNPASVVKFNKLLRKDYKEFLGYNKKDYRNKKPKKVDKLNKKLILKYHQELFYENEIADKYNIKKNTGIKFIKEIDESKDMKKNDMEF